MLSPNCTPHAGSYMNDRTTSLRNRTNRTVCMDRHENYSYDMGCYGVGGSTGVLPIHNDELTSFRLV
ncbi:peptidase inhibitor family I36 protein [Streptomyces sp. NPDC058295]|uniref:peptidase inhibitor family I36 protein n=1 Tax=Streptomyces sp. NPDC058295 TaxID=3346431 RepID=UPI0036E16C3D